MFDLYQVIVVGGGHAGCEAAAVSARSGCKTLLISMNMMTLGQMSCNPAMGGIAKGQIVRELDALGGFSGIVSDESMIQFRMLNRSKGKAMWSPRAQNDRMLFSMKWREKLENIPNLDIYQDMVVGLIVKDNIIKGVLTSLGHEILANAVVLTNGTFLNGLIHIGDKQLGGGRIGENKATGLTENLIKLGFESGRMKTGTPPRLDGRSINYDLLEEQKGDEEVQGFSFLDIPKPKQQASCYITYTSDIVHETLKEGFDRSPMFNGRIQSLGPRYCPSIEDKINRFSDKDRHQLFIEPEGWHTNEIYINGFSTSLPEEVQFKALRKIVGLENVKMYRPGYAIEYDYFPPIQLDSSLQTKLIKGLFFAGQINGTTGYEEAAGQGYIAGINASLYAQDKEFFILKRNESYIGVLIDDLITKGTEEPYRMFTSRAEFRILLRQDNADIRLTPRVIPYGLIDENRLNRYNQRKDQIKQAIDLFKELRVEPNQINDYLIERNGNPLTQKMPLAQVMLRPEIDLSDLIEQCNLKSHFEKIDKSALESAEIEWTYQGYIQKEEDIAQKMNQLEYVKIPSEFNYDKLSAISIESREKFKKIKPENIGQAKRISGIKPSDISILLIYLGR
ncbi:MAG: tRNA uridine-5-carboxymethylaminomethyl(34) synthesis enzyme MnmG [Chitinophagales bacterium]|jgi:tRNA uridine 5-carboxymethylaminomethyl modification enzyme|nr:tRNA uridine-5-carboxymethylaminomethyl(34) synthesis enzyme MnmG [Chitinophagales bacterium]